MLESMEALFDGVRRTRWPQLLCPICRNGHLPLREPDFRSWASAASVRAKSNPSYDWEPDWDTGQFAARLRCNNKACGENVVVSGSYTVEFDQNEVDGPYYEDVLHVEYFQPPLSLGPLPDRCPPQVRDEIDSAAKVFWLDSDAAANRLRVAVERLLDALRIPKLNSKRKPLTLHDRLGKLPAKHQEARVLLEAVKWVGNEGSHGDGLSRREVHEGAAFLHRALQQLFDPTAVAIARRAAAVNKRKGIKRP